MRVYLAMPCHAVLCAVYATSSKASYQMVYSLVMQATATAAAASWQTAAVGAVLVEAAASTSSNTVDAQAVGGRSVGHAW